MDEIITSHLGLSLLKHGNGIVCQDWKEKKVPISHANIIFWHFATPSSLFFFRGFRKSRTDINMEGVVRRSLLKSLCRQAVHPLPLLLLLLVYSCTTHPSQTFDVTEHALKSFCSFFFSFHTGFVWVCRRCVLKANQPIWCHLSLFEKTQKFYVFVQYSLIGKYSYWVERGEKKAL